MYIVGKNGSARFSEEESNALTDVFNKVADHTGKEINSFREGILATIEFFKNPPTPEPTERVETVVERKPNTIEFTPNAFENIKEAFNNLAPAEAELEEYELGLVQLQEISKMLWPPLSIEDQLRPGQVLYEMNENEYKVFKQIQSNRAKGLEKHGVEPETDAQLTKAMIFNEAVLYEWAGQPYTGLSL